ncbi:hypothetical protein DL98DRAFT_574072 [Cadophora sp. DSE1049]|nr:hypothetical protein DL98DRAFT_574072 [Cadophora sp. DSE1049]
MTPSVTSSPNPKLRSSCDSCGTAKIKCDRQRPSCGRCSLLSSTCIYGPSRKSGKPPRTKLSSNSGRIEKRVFRPSHPLEKIATLHSGEFQTVSGPVQNNFSNPMTENTFSSGLYTGSGGQDNATGFYPPLSFDQFGAWPLGNFPMDFNFVPPAACPTNTLSKDSHSCPRESYEIFRDLICPSPFLHAPESNSSTVSAPLDEVLQFNKTAINRLMQVLKCPCAKSGHRAMVHASIVSRILIWYQQAAGWAGSSAWGSRPTQSTSSDSGSLTESASQSSNAPCDMDSIPLAKATGFAVGHVPLSLGVFRIEDENVQAAFRNQLVLSELKRAAGLIDLFLAQDSVESAGGLYFHLGTWLKAEHERTVETLRKRLRTLNE